MEHYEDNSRGEKMIRADFEKMIPDTKVVLQNKRG